MQKLIFFLILCLLTINVPAFAQTTRNGNPERREVGKQPGNTRQVSNRGTSTRAGTAKRQGAGVSGRKAIPRTTRQEQPVQTRRAQLPPVGTWPEAPSRRSEYPDDNRWSSREENEKWRDSRNCRKEDDRGNRGNCGRDRRDRDWDRDDRHEGHCKGHGNGKGKGHYKKKGKGHWKHHECD